MHNWTKASQIDIIKFFTCHASTDTSKMVTLKKSFYLHKQHIDKLIRIKTRRIIKCLECGKNRAYTKSSLTSCPCTQLLKETRAKESQIMFWSLKDLLQHLVLSEYIYCSFLFLHMLTTYYSHQMSLHCFDLIAMIKSKNLMMMVKSLMEMIMFLMVMVKRLIPTETA